jgi:hypothetical protein
MEREEGIPRDPRDPEPAGEEPDEDLVRREEDAAAAEAGEIGGPGSDEDLPEEERPLAEAGEGYAEGFEEAERDLVEGASHGGEAPDPEELAGEAEDERSGAEYGEPDRVESSEREEEGQEGRELPPKPGR